MSKKFLSFVLPQNIVSGKTRLGQHFEVNFENGVKVLNSENANYSFGSLHQIMLKGIDEVLKKHQPKKILMLGLGAGSAVKILHTKCKWDFKIQVVEIDPDLIEIAKEHFDLAAYNNIEVLNMDAEKAVAELPSASFDLIVDDVFWDHTVPQFCLSDSYLQNNKKLLTDKGIYMRNLMKDPLFEYKKFENKLNVVFDKVESVQHAVYGNKIYFCQRLK